MSSPQTRAEAFDRLVKRQADETIRLEREWDIRDRLPDIAPAKYRQLYVYPNHARVTIGKEGSETAEALPTLQTLHVLGRAFSEQLERRLVRDGTASLAPAELEYRPPSVAANITSGLSPFIMTIMPPGSDGCPGGLVTVEWFARVGIELVEFVVEWPWTVVEPYSSPRMPFSNGQPSRVIRCLGNLDIQYERYPDDGRIKALKTNRFHQDSSAIGCVYHFDGQADLQDVLTFASGHRAPGRHVLYWIEIVSDDQHATAADLADRLEPYGGSFKVADDAWFTVERLYENSLDSWVWTGHTESNTMMTASKGFTSAEAAYADALFEVRKELNHAG